MSENSEEKEPKKEKIRPSKKSKSKSKSIPKKSSDPSPLKQKKSQNILLSYITYKNSNPISLDSLKNGRRIFNNKTELTAYDSNDPEFNKNFIEFRQLFFEDLLLTKDLKDDSENNVINKVRAQSALFSTFIYDGEFIEPFINQFKMPSIIVRHQENQKFNAMDEYGNYIKFIFP